MRMTLAFDTILYFFVTFNDLMKSLRDISRERVKTTFLQFPSAFQRSNRCITKHVILSPISHSHIHCVPTILLFWAVSHPCFIWAPLSCESGGFHLEGHKCVWLTVFFLSLCLIFFLCVMLVSFTFSWLTSFCKEVSMWLSCPHTLWARVVLSLNLNLPS